MRASVLTALLFASLAFGEGTGTLRGKVTVVDAAVGSRASGPSEVIVFLEDAASDGPMPKGPFEMIQEGKAFLPSVLVVPKGATVTFPNHDALLHNVFSLSPGNAFDLGLRSATAEPAKATFGSVGVVSVYCNIHPQMVGYIVVVSNPFFTRPAKDGAYELKNVPAGSYHLVAWFPHGPPVRSEVAVRAGAVTPLDVSVREPMDASRHNKKDGSRYGSY